MSTATIPTPSPSLLAEWPSVERCALVSLPSHGGAAGRLTVLETHDAVPFTIRRAFSIADVPAGATRGGHANAITQELVVCLAGGVTVRARDARAEWSARLTDASVGAYLPPMCWVDLLDFAPGTVLLVLADTSWREAELAYYRDHAQWQRAIESTHAITEL